MTRAFLARRPAGRGNHGGTGPANPAGRYGLLLLVLIATYLLSAFSGRMLAENLQAVLFAVVLLLALRTSPLPGRWSASIAAAALVGSGAALWASLTGTQTGEGAADLWKAIVLLLTAVLIVRRVLARPTVTIQSIYGALSAYLITGLMFAACYSAIWHLYHSPFFADHQPANVQTFQYFSFTTLTTLGYGDFTAAGSGGRAIAVLEALAGQVFLATLVARLVSAYRGSGERDDP
jgi:Ion channel